MDYANASNVLRKKRSAFNSSSSPSVNVVHSPAQGCDWFVGGFSLLLAFATNVSTVSSVACVDGTCNSITIATSHLVSTLSFLSD
jgi:hypothetical protein